MWLPIMLLPGQPSSLKNGYTLSKCAHNASTRHGPNFGRGNSVVGIVIGALLMVCAACAQIPTTFEPSHPLSAETISSDDFEQVLQDHVRAGWVDYPALGNDQRFDRYLALLDRIDPNQLSPADRLAFWINAYNAFAIEGILDGLTPKPYLGWYRYFKSREYRIGGRRLTLSDLEHGILRAQFHEPRIHMAIVCASRSCPALRTSLYRGVQIDKQLDEAASAFINDPSRNRFDRRARIASLSMIFKWFEEDFVGTAGSVLAFVARYVNDPELARDLMQPGYRVEYLEYDWSLNGIPPKER
ncbi:MAG TPA: DUF547 domain-containing protein [Nitrospira sp.]